MRAYARPTTNSTWHLLVMATKQVRAQQRARVVACAKSLVVEYGPAAVKLLPLSLAFDTSTLSCRRWLADAGFDLTHLKRGRPEKEARDEMLHVYTVEALRARAGA